MKIIKISLFVIAISTFASAVEDIYGWSNVKPLAEDAWNASSNWSNALISGEANAEGIDSVQRVREMGADAAREGYAVWLNILDAAEESLEKKPADD